jgi:putative SOS response-associated peptidase YedK
MCGRYDNRIPAQKVADYFNLRLDACESFQPNHNVCPTQTAPIITNIDPNRLTAARWGLVPFWAKDDKIGAKMINARGETVAEKPAFRNALAKRRCLVPAAAFYEWRKDPGGKTPLRFSLASDEIFAFAGLYELWKPPGADAPLTTYSIITTSANVLVSQAHDRMPVILAPESAHCWLNGETADCLSLLTPFSADRMAFSEMDSGLLSVR